MHSHENESDFDFGITFLGYFVICAHNASHVFVTEKTFECVCAARLECNFLFEIPAATLAK